MLSPQTVVAGRYRLEKEIAHGGMGSVWMALDDSLERHVAIKFMDGGLAASSAARRRFEREAKSSAKLRGHNVVQIFDYGVDDERPFLVMELLEGEDLGARLRRSGDRLSMKELVPIALGTASGLEVAHAAQVVHRDLKPANVYLAKSGIEEIVKLLDFGLAKALGVDPTAAKVTTATKKGLMMGTPLYMSPEQARASKQVDHRADLWSFAVVLFRALTGHLPFKGDLLADLLMQICVKPIPPPSSFAPDLPKGADAFFERALRRDPAERFQSAREMGAAFAELARGRMALGALGAVSTMVPGSALQPAKTEALPWAEAPPRAEAAPWTEAPTRVEQAPFADVPRGRVERRRGEQYENFRKALGTMPPPPQDAAPPSSARGGAAGAPRSELGDAPPPSYRDVPPLSIRGRGRVWIEWDSAESVATVLHYGVQLSDEEAVVAYEAEVATELQRLGRRVRLLICLDGIMGPPEMIRRACGALDELSARFSTCAAFYGQHGAFTVFAELTSRRAGARCFYERHAALKFVMRS